MRSLVFVLSFAFALPAYAGVLWDLTIAGPMFYNGELARESVTYRYDPDDLMSYTCKSWESPCALPDAWTGFIAGGGGGFYPNAYSLIWGDTKAVMYDGAIQGGSGPVSIRAFADGGFGDYCSIGGTRIQEAGLSWCGWLQNPVERLSTYSSLMFWRTSEGPVHLIDCFIGGCVPPFSQPLTRLVVSLTPVALPEPGTVALLAVWFAGLTVVRPLKIRRRRP